MLLSSNLGWSISDQAIQICHLSMLTEYSLILQSCSHNDSRLSTVLLLPHISNFDWEQLGSLVEAHINWVTTVPLYLRRSTVGQQQWPCKASTCSFFFHSSSPTIWICLLLKDSLSTLQSTLHKLAKMKTHTAFLAPSWLVHKAWQHNAPAGLQLEFSRLYDSEWLAGPHWVPIFVSG